jgi:hypothetical protein
MMNRFPILCFYLILGVSVANASIITVSPGTDLLQTAVQGASAEDVIELQPGTHNLSSQIT